MHVAELRKKIDALDQRLVELLNARARVAMQIGRIKQISASEVYVPAREKAVLAHVRKAASCGPLSKDAVAAIYREIMSASLALERRLQVAHFGQPTTFTHQAARSRFGAGVDYVPCETIGDVFDSVQKNRADYGVVPIENSTEGAVTHTLDEFVRTPLKICAEIYLPIAHNLMASGPRKGIRQVASHPQVLAQCRNWLRAEMPHVEIIPAASSARAAEMAVRDRRVAAIGSTLAAEQYHLRVLAKDIQDLTGNMTRFLVIGKSFGHATGEDKTSIFFAVKHKAGALHNALGALKEYRLNMTKIESRPNKLKAWEYLFFVDIEGHVEEQRVSKALKALERHCTLMTVLGAYPRAAGMED